MTTLTPKPMSKDEIKTSEEIFALLKGRPRGRTRRILEIVEARLTIEQTLSGEL